MEKKAWWGGVRYFMEIPVLYLYNTRTNIMQNLLVTCIICNTSITKYGVLFIEPRLVSTIQSIRAKTLSQ